MVADGGDAAIKRRRIELNIHTLRGEVMRNEIEVLDLERTITAKRASMDALNAQIGELEKELAREGVTGG